jgi:prepilin-type N-terminal cleavage/methylation domain-containing protein
MRRGFTLLELMISVVIVSLMVFFISRGESVLRNAAGAMERANAAQHDRQQQLDLFVQDLLQADKLRILSGREYDQLYLQESRHSLYGRPRAAVVYLVKKPDRTLMRLEAAHDFALPLTSGQIERVDALTVSHEPLRAFKIYRAAGEGRCRSLIFLEYEAQEPLLLELGLLNQNMCQIQ